MNKIYIIIPVLIGIAFLATAFISILIYLYKTWKIQREFDKTLEILSERVKKDREKMNEDIRQSLIKLEERDVNLDGED